MESGTQNELIKLLEKSDSLSNIQLYINKVLEIRKLNDQSPEKKMLLLTEEVGELAKAIRKEQTDMHIDLEGIDRYESISGEVADVLIVLLSLCNELGIDCYDALLSKERLNVKRTWMKES